jgi:sigma-B regulation protein RsbQ
MTDAVQRNNVRQAGAGQPMLFVHGYGCDQAMWRFVAPAFVDRYRVVTFDQVGHGGSDATQFDEARHDRLQGYADDLLEICDELRLDDVILVGHSVGATIGLLAAIAAPERFAKLVLIGPNPRYINDGDYVGGFEKADIDGLLEALERNHLGWSATMAPVIMGNGDRPELGKELEASFCRTDPRIAKHFARVTFQSDNRGDLGRVRQPTLILQCSRDAIAPEEVGRYVHARIASSELVLMDATGHCPNLSAPDETVRAIERFLMLPGSAS